MRCSACDTLLNDRESCRKDMNGRYVDLCNSCFSVSTQTIIESLDDDYATGKRTYNGFYSSKSQTKKGECT
jgi:hypothetical protein